MQLYIPDLVTVETLHDIVLDASGGKIGIHDRGLITRAVERPATYIQYIDDYDTDTICALLIDGIARYHGFKDGNKRTALMTAIFTYRLNGVHFRATLEMNQDFDDLIIWVVKKKPSINTIVKRLKELRQIYEAEKKEPWNVILVGFISQALKHGDKD